MADPNQNTQPTVEGTPPSGTTPQTVTPPTQPVMQTVPVTTQTQSSPTQPPAQTQPTPNSPPVSAPTSAPTPTPTPTSPPTPVSGVPPQSSVQTPSASPPPSNTNDISKYTIGRSGSGSSSGNSGSQEVALEKKNAKLYVIGIIVAIIVLVATIVTLYLRAQQAIEDKEMEETATIEEVVEEATPTPEATPIPREDIALDILNGSGTAGLAGTIAETFEELGYEILEIGNADDTEGNQLYVNPDIDKDLLSLLLEDVLEELDIASVSGDLEDSSASAQIILGS
jgi:hypothetical protein